MKRRLISFFLSVTIVAAMLPTVALPAQAADYNVVVLGSSIYANGTPLLITEGTQKNTTNIYIDANKNGVADAGELTLAGAGIANAPEDNMPHTNASLKTVYGGAFEQNFSGNTFITMTGGSIGKIFGGNLADRFSDGTGNFSGTAYIKITGGYVNETVYLGNNNPTNSSTAPNSAKGTLIVSGNPNIRWDIHGGSKPNNRGFTGVTTGFVLQIPSTSTGSVRTESFQHGIIKTDASNYITVGTATSPADLPITIAAGETMTVKAGSNITIAGKFVNNGTLIIESGATLTLAGSENANNGTITNNGTLNCQKHIYSNDCDASCNFCGATRSASHAWQNATCEAPKICSRCGAEEGTELGHSYSYRGGDVITETCNNGCGHSANATLTVGDSYTYTGEPITPAQVTYSQSWKGEKPAVVYTNNVNAGTATATLTIGDATMTKTFIVARKDLADAQVILTPESAVYNGQAQTPDLVVMLDGKVLTKDADYYVTSNKKTFIYSGTYKFYVTGMGNYTGEKTQTYQILNADFSAVTVEAVGTYVYNGEQQVPTVTTNFLSADSNAVQILYGRSRYGSYHATIPGYTNAGTYTVYYMLRADNHNDYLGEFTFTIEKAPVEAPALENKVYNGQNQIADIANTDLYTVHVNNGGIEVGEYEVVLKLKNSTNYRWSTTDSAELTLTFTITPATNSWTTSPTISGWVYGQSPNTPTAAAQHGTVEVNYTGTANDGTTYSSTAAPTKAGSYTAIFRVAATENYSGLEISVAFVISKAFYDLSGTRWSYSQPYAYDGLEKAVTITGLPDGITPVYSGNTAKDVGEYVATATFTYDTYNYNPFSVGELNWSITNNWNPSEYTVSAPNGNGWLKESFVIAPNTGYLVATHNTAEGAWAESLTYGSETDSGSVNIYLKDTATGAISLAKTLTYKLDKTVPTGKVEFVDRTSWETFVNAITFGLLYKDQITIAMEGADTLSGVASLEYVAADRALTLEEVKAITNWNPYNGSIGVTLEDAKQFVYFLRITDKAGNVTYASSDGAQYDISAPVVAGVENGKTYYTTQAITVQDTNLDSVKVNGSATLDSFHIGGDFDATYVVVATDKVGNETVVTFTTRSISTLALPLDGLNDQNIKSAHLPILESVKASVEAANTAHAADSEKLALQDILKQVEDLRQVVEDCQAEIDRIDAAAEDFTPATVNSEDLAALEKLSKDIQSLLDGENLTDAERADLTEQAEDVADMRKSVADAQAENTRLQNAVKDYDSETVTSKQEADLEKLLEEMQKHLDSPHLTNEEAEQLKQNAEMVEQLLSKIQSTEQQLQKTSENVNAYQEETVKSSDQEAIAQSIRDIEALLATQNITEEEAASLKEAKAKAEALLDRIRKAADAAATEHAEKTQDITAENVSPDNQNDLEKAKEELEKALAENAGNYTEQEKQAISEDIERIQKALASLEKVKAVEAKIQALPQAISPENKEAVAAAQSALDALSDREKAMVNAELKQTLAAAAEAANHSPQNFPVLIAVGIAVAAGMAIFVPVLIKRKRR